MHQTQLGTSHARSVLLTGATGFVGRFLLAELLQESKTMVYCLVRARSHQEATTRIQRCLRHWDLWRPGYEGRIVALPGDLRQSRLGLCESDYQTVVRNAISIFHCGASVNHLESYNAAKAANVLATNELLKIASREVIKQFHHISTLGIFSRNDQGGLRVVTEETPIERERHRASDGYAASKWVAEGIVVKARESGVPCNIFRLGLLWADSQQGRFDERQHVYRLIKSCLLAGCGIEDFYYDPDPVPVDYAARAIVALAARSHGKGDTYHITSVGRTPGGLFEKCNQLLESPLKLMPFYDWTRELKRLHEGGYALPMVPLIEFAFSMNRQEFLHHLHLEEQSQLRVSGQRTSRELRDLGIFPPPSCVDLLGVCIEAMRERDGELGESRPDGVGCGRAAGRLETSQPGVLMNGRYGIR